MKVQFSVRIEDKDKEKIELIAKENSRTINGQIDFLIKQCIEKYEDIKGEIKIPESSITKENKDIKSTKVAN